MDLQSTATKMLAHARRICTSAAASTLPTVFRGQEVWLQLDLQNKNHFQQPHVDLIVGLQDEVIDNMGEPTAIQASAAGTHVPANRPVALIPWSGYSRTEADELYHAVWVSGQIRWVPRDVWSRGVALHGAVHPPPAPTACFQFLRIPSHLRKQGMSSGQQAVQLPFAATVLGQNSALAQQPDELLHPDEVGLGGENGTEATAAALIF